MNRSKNSGIFIYVKNFTKSKKETLHEDFFKQSFRRRKCFFHSEITETTRNSSPEPSQT